MIPSQYLCSNQNEKIMLSKEEVADVISYCKEHGCSYKERLAELGIPEWKFYDSKYKYAIRERKEFDKGRFLQLRTGSDGSMAPFPSFDSAKTGRKADKAGLLRYFRQDYAQKTI